MVNCPKCDAAIDVDEDELDEGDTLTCDECGADLAVESLNPLELTPADDEDDEEEEEEDDIDYDEDGDDDDDEEEDEEEEDWH